MVFTAVVSLMPGPNSLYYLRATLTTARAIMNSDNSSPRDTALIEKVHWALCTALSAGVDQVAAMDTSTDQGGCAPCPPPQKKPHTLSYYT